MKHSFQGNTAARPEVFASGFQSTEGPAFDRRGNLFVCDMALKKVFRITPGGVVSEFIDTLVEGGAQPTGSKFHANGHLFVADLVRAEVLDVTPDGTMQSVARAYRGERLHGPNDLIFASNGDLYFTDPGYSNLQNPYGNVYLLRADGTLQQIAGGFALCNGIALSADERTLYVAETYTNLIHHYALDERGLPAGHARFAHLEGGYGPDGMALDVEGNLYVAYCEKGVIAVLDPAGELLAELPAGVEWPTNLAFWGTSLYITGEDRVMRLDVGVEGLPVFGSATSSPLRSALP